MDLTVTRVDSLEGELILPGDKSITHRALLLGALAEGDTRVEGFCQAEDCGRTIACLQGLGVQIDWEDKVLFVRGKGLYGLREPEDVLNAGNSGTTMRLLCGILAGQSFYTVLTGEEGLRRRPMDRVAQPLGRMGAVVMGRGKGRFPPLTISGGFLSPIDYTLPVASAQVKSCLLLAGLYAGGETVVREPVASRDHTERMLKLMGAPIQRSLGEVCIQGGGALRPAAIFVPGDLSSGAFFLVAGAIIPGSRLALQGVGVNPTRTGILQALQLMRAPLSILNVREQSGERVADIEVKNDRLRGVPIAGNLIPWLIDELPILAVAATQAEGETVVRDAAELRVKETDRIQAIVSELSKMGAKIAERPDGFVVEGPTPLQGARCSSYGDHRIAMALAVAGLLAHGETIVEGVECIDDSFPGFIELLQKIAGEGVLSVVEEGTG
jgi:3-phosphoshikimate 1-carboxyvinyltransferase